MNPALAEPPLAPIEDREPQVTTRIAALLEKAREGTLALADFAYARTGFFPDRMKAYQETLRALGPAGRLVLVQRITRGDDRIYTYEVPFGTSPYRFTVALAPDDRLTYFGLRPK
jgi:hypothetical protein